jgi:hypothetical protein
MHTTNYFNSLIIPSPDCPAPAATEPPTPGTVAAMQYNLLAASPYALTSDDVIWTVTATRKGMDPADTAARAAFFAKPQACMRASPLVKTYGWGLLYDAQGRIALADPWTHPYRLALSDRDITKHTGMRNARKTPRAAPLVAGRDRKIARPPDDDRFVTPLLKLDDESPVTRGRLRTRRSKP